jgi:hypothetical protein
MAQEYWGVDEDGFDIWMDVPDTDYYTDAGATNMYFLDEATGEWEQPGVYAPYPDGASDMYVLDEATGEWTQQGTYAPEEPPVGAAVPDWWGTATQVVKDFYTKRDAQGNPLGYDWQKILGTGAGALSGLKAYSDAANFQQPKGGYQGGIPALAAVRQAIPVERPEGYRPGQGGQRYFTDVQYTAPAGVDAARATAAQQAQTLQQRNVAPQLLAAGGIARGRYLRGGTDGMADKLDTSIDGKQPAKLSHGEFVIPADVVSHLGNGNSEAGARKLYQMMDKLRQARTGTKKQGKQIDPDKFVPGGLAAAYAGGGEVKRFAGVTDGSLVQAPSGAALSSGVTGDESSISNWAGPYVTGMLGKGQALSETPYQAYGGPLTAGPSALQQQAFGTASAMNIPASTMGAFAPQSFTDEGVAGRYMNPYLQQALEPQIAEARRQSEIQRMQDAARLTQAGAFGGSRQAVMESERNRNLLQGIAGITGTGYKTAYEQGAQQFNVEQARRQAAQEAGNQFGLAALGKQVELGGIQRGVEAEGVAADRAAFEAERDYPYKMVQYQQSLLQGLPLAARAYNIQPPDPLTSGLLTAQSIYDVLNQTARS